MSTSGAAPKPTSPSSPTPAPATVSTGAMSPGAGSATAPMAPVDPVGSAGSAGPRLGGPRLGGRLAGAPSAPRPAPGSPVHTATGPSAARPGVGGPGVGGPGAPGVNGPGGSRPAAGAPGAAGAAGGAKPVVARPQGRRVQLAVARIDPWSAMKMSFLLSFAAGVGLVVATMLLWMILSGMHVFSDIDNLVRSIQPNSAEPFSIMDWIGLPRVTSLAMVVAVIDVILLTALGTLFAYLYNICASLVGGVQLTLSDD